LSVISHRLAQVWRKSFLAVFSALKCFATPPLNRLWLFTIFPSKWAGHMVQNSKPYIFVSHKLLLALKPLRKIRNSDAVGFAKADRGEFAGVDCPANLLVIGTDEFPEFRGLFDCDRDWLDRRKLHCFARIKSAFKMNNIRGADVALLHGLWMTKLHFARHTLGLFVSGNEWCRHDSEMEPQGGRRNDVQTVGLNAETKKVPAPSRRGDISLDIRFYRTLTGTAFPRS
jgi:hypothetical protein